ncbi:serine/threonine-protein kinase [Nonomuraea sp. B19D2]|uniref:serine/threonine-protein kinase n=1 Tax=Nonomuraea sp. B19D2 TaxID=3159561 RepID=UPI0032DB325E
MSEPEWLGRYRLIRVLGEGGQGKVYLAEAPQGARVAVKVLHPGMVLDEQSRRRFLREAELAQRVAPFCTARVLDAGVLDGRAYIVSEYVSGVSLETLVGTEGPRSGSSLDRLAVTTLTALSAIHRAGIVHRDFKPGNVLLGPEGPVVIDFGIARMAEQSTTRSGLIGTPAYMAPEQLNGVPASAASDVFAWAATMVLAATGRRAFRGDTPAAVMHAIFSERPDLSGVPRELAGVLDACLAKQPEHRPTAADVLRHLTGESAGLGRSGVVPATPPRDQRLDRPRPFIAASFTQFVVGVATLITLLASTGPDESGAQGTPVFWPFTALLVVVTAVTVGLRFTRPRRPSSGDERRGNLRSH